jgi:hypothetical protein
MRTWILIGIIVLLSLTIVVLLLGGGFLGASPATQTASPSPALPTEQTLEESGTPSPSSTTAPEESPTATTAAQDQETIYISQPGQGSSVTSPVLVKGIADSTFEQNLVLTITDEDGDLLLMQATTIQTPLGERGPYSAALDFSVGSQQAGRISVFSLSAMDGSLEHLSSVEVSLLPEGEAQILGPALDAESIRIDTPLMSAVVSGGTVTVSGFSDYFFESNLGLALCGQGGDGAPHPLCGTEDNLLASGFAMIDAPDIGQPGPFSGEIQYSVTTETIARLVVYAASPRDGGLLHANSIIVTLLP